MKVLFTAILAFLSLLAVSADAADKSSALPHWLLGDWIVTKVYEADIPYPDPEGEPKVRFGSQKLTIGPDKLSLSGEVCTDLDIVTKRGTLGQILAGTIGRKPAELGLSVSHESTSYLVVTCGKSFQEDTEERTHTPSVHWHILLKSRDNISMPFFGGAYLELRRPAPTS
jgi:hypothetical protein